MTSDNLRKRTTSPLNDALIEAALKNDIALTNELLSQGADPNVKVGTERNAPLLTMVFGWRSTLNFRALTIAQDIARDSKKLIEMLIEAGADITVSAPDGSNTVLLAMALEWREMVDYLIDHEVNVNASSSISGYTPLMLANDPILLHKLLDAGASIDAQDNMGNTALMLAVRRQQPELVQALLERGANKSITCRNKQDDALSYARLVQNSEITALLGQVGKVK